MFKQGAGVTLISFDWFAKKVIGKTQMLRKRRTLQSLQWAVGPASTQSIAKAYLDLVPDVLLAVALFVAFC